ncbi:MAG: cytochrome c oxidase subunit I [Armatimonadetes bacterium]|nr:cytochrome c oxidase subunit I [Armatimonadota bacterium]
MHIEPAKRVGSFDKLLPRPLEPRGLVGWLTTIDHKRIGILYGVTALCWFIVGGIEALMIRTQLVAPGLSLYSADLYNQLFTMHGTTMIFLVVMPLAAAFFNFMIPLMIGARDVAFPRLNAFSYWMFLGGSVLLNVSWFTTGAPDGGWFGYTPLTSDYSSGFRIDYWVMGLQILGVSSIVAALNFLTTIINMRAPGMTMMRMPVFCWMTLVTAFLLILAFPAITIALVELMFDRKFHTNFFETGSGGLAILWQHLFWVFGHPEVYILILPPMGIVSEVLPSFSRKPLFGYPLVVGSGVAIGFMGFAVWSHHMFTTGLGNIAVAAFALTTMAIAVPTGVKIFNWVGTLYGGQLRMKLPMMYACAFIFLFMIGGFSGLTHASPPHDTQQQDTYYIVAHFHYVLIGGAIFGLFAGIYYWFPKITGRMMSEGKLAYTAFWLFFIGFNLTFFPMHWLGLNGMPRRIYTYAENMGWNTLNHVCTLGAFMMAIAVLIIYHDMLSGARRGKPAGNDPWDARTLEWSIPSPPPVYNFKTTPVVHSIDDWWFTKHPHALVEHEEAEHPPVHVACEEHGIHMPGASWFPLLAAGGLMLGAAGLTHNHWAIAIAGGFLGVLMIFGWAFEPIGGYHIHFSHHEEGPALEATAAAEEPVVEQPPAESAEESSEDDQ